MNPFLNEVVSSLNPTLKPSPHQVLVECPVDFVVENHAGALFQIITNLILNGHLHAFRPDEPGTIILRSVVVPAEGAAFLLSVRDNGMGMAPDIQDKIFEPFFTTSRMQGGTGLGLSIVAALVKTLGGTITVQSQPGQGSTFSVCLPLVAPDQTPEV
jgi:signal transduction histidine kinase